MADSEREQVSQIVADMDDDSDQLSFNVPAEAGARGVIVTDNERRVRFTDARIHRLLAIDPKDVLGKEIGEVINSVFHEAELTQGNSHETVEDVMELIAPDQRVLHRYSTPLLDEDHQPIGRIEVYSDITKRRQLEEANASLYKQVHSAYDELKATQEQLLQSEKLRAIGEIASGVAHDFNNTLGIILGNVQLLLRMVDDPKMRTRLESIEQAALDGAETVRRIQEFTKLRPDEPLASVDLSATAAKVIEMMKPSWQSAMQASDRRIDLELDLADGVLAAGIAPEIREVLTNIILNAVQAMPEGGRIKVSTGRSESSVWISVEDSGQGMTDEVRKRVFDPFFTTKGVSGTGLGMSVAYGIVKRHRGMISIDSTPGTGTTVTISLPPACADFNAESMDSEESPAVASARILVVDDEEMFAQVFVEMLSEYGHAVCVAKSGLDAIEQFRREKFDLVFTDLGMPGMSGWQVAKGIKDIEPGTPVVLLTGWGTKVDSDRLAESKVDMVLSKPVKIEDLSAIVSKALSGNNPRS